MLLPAVLAVCNCTALAVWSPAARLDLARRDVRVIAFALHPSSRAVLACVPLHHRCADNYEVIDSSLDDIKFALAPAYTKMDIAGLDHNRTLSTDVKGVRYLRGFVGMNNLKRTDFINVVVQAFCHVGPLRDFFLQPQNYATCTSALVHRFGELLRKLWSPSNFKSTVDPHEFVQEVVVASGKRFKIGTQAECVDFLSWFLNKLHT